MKIESEVLGDVLHIYNTSFSIEAYIDIASGGLDSINHVDVTLHEVSMFLQRAKTHYNKFLSTQQAGDF